jgi:hypothetical protein
MVRTQQFSESVTVKVPFAALKIPTGPLYFTVVVMALKAVGVPLPSVNPAVPALPL